MKKIDLHLHTVSTKSDADFTYSFDTLKKYVTELDLDCIAITNHNMFSRTQFESITKELDIVVLPGIEIDLEKGHLLLISSVSDLSDFDAKCQLVEKKIQNAKDTLTLNELKEIFPDLNKYILIPHYKKNPELPLETITELAPLITAGEVTSPKKFLSCIKNNNDLVPVCFSDMRIKKDIKNFSPRQTYIDTDDISLSSIKLCLSDKSKVGLCRSNGSSYFQVLSNGLQLSTKLNVILGGRSTGKTHTLEQIVKEGGYSKIKHIEQFELVERDSDKEKERFDTMLGDKSSLLTEDYLKPFKSVVDDVSIIDFEKEKNAIGEYLESLKAYAKEHEKQDVYSKAKLYLESEFVIKEAVNLKSLIDATITILSNMEYKAIIEKHVDRNSLVGLFKELIVKYKETNKLDREKRYANDTIEAIKRNLEMKSITPNIKEPDFFGFLKCISKISTFEDIVREIKKETTIQQKNSGHFKIVAKKKQYKGAQELKTASKTNQAFSQAYNEYDSPYKFLRMLTEIEIPAADYYKYFVKINYEVLNQDGFPVSGGERSEFRLLEKLQDANQYDMLLIDEPESSFDNIFLKQNVNTIIKDLSKTMPVVVVTHNSTVGASIKPDHLLVTAKSRDMSTGVLTYDIFSGRPSDKYLVGLTGEQVENYDSLLNCLEAGETTYTERKQSYEILKN